MRERDTGGGCSAVLSIDTPEHATGYELPSEVWRTQGHDCSDCRFPENLALGRRSGGQYVAEVFGSALVQLHPRMLAPRAVTRASVLL